MRKKRLLAAAVSLAITAGQLGIVAFADSTDDKSTDRTAAAAAANDATTSDAETTSGDEDTTGANDIGDVNGDGTINITDVSRLAAYIKSKKELDEKGINAADINADSTVNISDLSLLAGHVKGISSLSDYIDLPVVKNPREMKDNVSLIEFNVDKDTKTVSWDADKEMKQYIVTFSNGDKTNTQTVYSLSANIPYDMFKDGKLTVMITPVRNVKTEDGTRTKDYGDTKGYLLKIKPGTITGKITVADVNSKAKISWNAAEFAAGYHVYDVTNTEKDVKPKLIADTDTNELLTDFPNNSTIKLLIVPFNSVGEAEGVNAEMTGGEPVVPDPKPEPDPKPDPKPDPEPDPKPDPKTDLAAPTFGSYYYYSDMHSATIMWNAVTGAEGYEASIQIGDKWVAYETKDTKYTFENLAQRTGFKTSVRAFKTVDGKKVYGEAAGVTAITDGYIKCVQGTAIYASPDFNSAQLGWINTGDIVTQTDLPNNGWTRLFVLNTDGSQTGYVPSTTMKDYANSGISVISQDGYLGGNPAVLGCEETSLASVLNYQFDINVSKNTLIDYYMPEQAFYNGTINVDPNYCFWGSPYHMEGSVGYGCYAPLIAQSANQYLRYIGVRDNYNIALNTDYYTGDNVNKLKFDPSKLDLGDTAVSGGLDLNGLKAELDKGNNPIIWYSEIEPYAVCTQVITAGQKLTNPGTGTYNFTWYGRQHTVVLTGYDDAAGCFIIGNVENFNTGSYYGVTQTISYDTFMKSYTTLGRQTVIVSKK